MKQLLTEIETEANALARYGVKDVGITRSQEQCIYTASTVAVCSQFLERVRDGHAPRLEIIDHTDDSAGCRDYSLVFNNFSHRIEGWIVYPQSGPRLVTKMGGYN